MLITRRSPLSGKVNTRDIPVTEPQFADWKAGVLIQDAMPNISSDDREFIKTGITAEEWNAALGKEQE